MVKNVKQIPLEKFQISKSLRLNQVVAGPGMRREIETEKGGLALGKRVIVTLSPLLILEDKSSRIQNKHWSS